MPIVQYVCGRTLPCTVISDPLENFPTTGPSGTSSHRSLLTEILTLKLATAQRRRRAKFWSDDPYPKQPNCGWTSAHATPQQRVHLTCSRTRIQSRITPEIYVCRSFSGSSIGSLVRWPGVCSHEHSLGDKVSPKLLLESKREQRGTMAHEERDEDVHAWQPRTTRSRGERKGAHVRGIQMARTLDRSIW